MQNRKKGILDNGQCILELESQLLKKLDINTKTILLHEIKEVKCTLTY